MSRQERRRHKSSQVVWMSRPVPLGPLDTYASELQSLQQMDESLETVRQIVKGKPNPTQLLIVGPLNRTPAILQVEPITASAPLY